MKRTIYSRLAVIAAVATVQLAGQATAAGTAGLDQKFVATLNDYVKLRKGALKDLPALKPNSAPGDVLAQQGRMAERIQAARSGAHQGDICTPEVAAELKRLIAMSMQGPHGPAIRKSLNNAEVTSGAAPLVVNGRFPDKLPVASTPPTLLLNLPRLPMEVEYRVVGRALVLRDSTANVIIDFVPDALPVNR